MRTREEILTILARHKDELRQQFHVSKIGVFGSYSRGEALPQSDVDILVELEQPMGWEIVDLHQYLEALLGIKVDLLPWALSEERRVSGGLFRRTWSMPKRDVRLFLGGYAGRHRTGTAIYARTVWFRGVTHAQPARHAGRHRLR